MFAPQRPSPFLSALEDLKVEDAPRASCSNRPRTYTLPVRPRLPPCSLTYSRTSFSREALSGGEAPVLPDLARPETAAGKQRAI